MERSILFLLAAVFFMLAKVLGSEDGYSFVYRCSDASNDYYSFSSPQTDGVWTFVPQDGEGQVLNLDGAQTETVISFPAPSRGVLLYSGFSQLEIVYTNNRACEGSELAESRGDEMILQALFAIPHDRGR